VFKEEKKEQDNIALNFEHLLIVFLPKSVIRPQYV